MQQQQQLWESVQQDLPLAAAAAAVCPLPRLQRAALLTGTHLHNSLKPCDHWLSRKYVSKIS